MEGKGMRDSREMGVEREIEGEGEGNERQEGDRD